jgi:hypothetical protein
MDGDDSFSSAVWIEAEDDSAALIAARAEKRTRPCELWQADRFVARIDPEGPSGNGN